MSGVRNMPAGLASLSKLGSAMRAAPLRIRTNVAKEGSVALTDDLREDFDGGRTAYGDPRPLSKAGTPLSLVKSGGTKATLVFKAIGTILRVALGTKHAKFLVGKYGMLPNPKRLPSDWQKKLAGIVRGQVADIEREALR